MDRHGGNVSDIHQTKERLFLFALGIFGRPLGFAPGKELADVTPCVGNAIVVKVLITPYRVSE